ncbi:hypothetical protein [Saprospira grandis]|uniref:Tox-MPTase2 domain-containing protein n=1 Tax=Saprospira grandis (strain Lewin) TaxID=984262 RepID=H6L751_SAPGL|nr:hypothetical protein [Saprospira grandis]AFC26642.1 hypothetical protein SGRA_3927 [Saprospira grandis str. Lewin]
MDFYWNGSASSLHLNQASKSIQESVVTTIYKEYIESTIPLKSITVYYFKGSHDFGVNNKKGVFSINMGVQSGGEMMHSDNIYNLILTLWHEEQHNQGRGGDHYTHFDIEMEAREHKYFSQTSDKFKKANLVLLRKYVTKQPTSIIIEAFKRSVNLSTLMEYKSTFDYYSKLYKKNVEKFNSIVPESDKVKLVDMKAKWNELMKDAKSRGNKTKK